MDLFNQIGGALKQYADNSQENPRAQEDFDQISRQAPKSSIADGISGLFRSDQTPPFPQLAAQLFSHSNGQQRAGLLNMLLSAVGPMLFSQILKGKGLSGLGDLFAGGQTQVTPQQAEQIPPDAVQDIAAQAQEQNPSIVDRIGDFYADHPDLVKSLGSGAVSSVLSRMASSFGK